MSMCVTVGSNTAGQASFAMNFLLLFSLVFTGFLVNVNSIPGAPRFSALAQLYPSSAGAGQGLLAGWLACGARPRPPLGRSALEPRAVTAADDDDPSPPPLSLDRRRAGLDPLPVCLLLRL